MTRTLFVLQCLHGCVRQMYSPASSSELVRFSELAEASSRSDMVLGVSASDPEVGSSVVWQKF